MQTLQKLQKQVEDSFDDAVKTSRSGIEPIPNVLLHPGSVEISHHNSTSPDPDKTSHVDIKVMSQVITDLRMENDSLLAEGTRLGKRLGMLEEKHRERLRELELVNKQKQALESRLRGSDELSQRCAALQTQLERTESELSQERRGNRHSSSIKAESDSDIHSDNLKEQLHTLREECKSLVLSNRALEDAAERFREQSAARVTSLESEIIGMKQYIVDLEERLRVTEDNPGLINPGNPTFHGSSVDGPVGSDSVQWSIPTDVGLLESQLSEKDHLIDALESQINEANKHRQHLEIELSLKTSRISELERKLEMVEQLRRDLSESLVAEVARNDSKTEKELFEARQECSALRARLRELESSRSNPPPHEPVVFRKFEMALQAIGKLQDDLQASLQREVSLRERLQACRNTEG